jgi:hypothetical protein
MNNINTGSETQFVPKVDIPKQKPLEAPMAAAGGSPPPPPPPEGPKGGNKIDPKYKDGNYDDGSKDKPDTGNKIDPKDKDLNHNDGSKDKPDDKSNHGKGLYLVFNGDDGDDGDDPDGNNGDEDKEKEFNDPVIDDDDDDNINDDKKNPYNDLPKIDDLGDETIKTDKLDDFNQVDLDSSGKSNKEEFVGDGKQPDTPPEQPNGKFNPITPVDGESIKGEIPTEEDDFNQVDLDSSGKSNKEEFVGDGKQPDTPPEQPKNSLKDWWNKFWGSNKN